MKINLREEAKRIKQKMYSGILTYDEAKKELQPFIDIANENGSKIAKKYGKKFYKINFINVIR